LESCDDRERQLGVTHTVEKSQAAGLVFPPMNLIDDFKQAPGCFNQNIASVVLSI
jgi:hypothetical protein